MEATRAELNDAAQLLRTMIDRMEDRLIDSDLITEEADQQTRPYYDAVTLLHEHATKEA